MSTRRPLDPLGTVTAELADVVRQRRFGWPAYRTPPPPPPPPPFFVDQYGSARRRHGASPSVSAVHRRPRLGGAAHIPDLTSLKAASLRTGVSSWSSRPAHRHGPRTRQIRRLLEELAELPLRTPLTGPLARLGGWIQHSKAGHAASVVSARKLDAGTRRICHDH